MPTYHLTAPNGRTYQMRGPAGLSEDDVFEHVIKFDPEAGVAPPPPKTGLLPTFESGLENLWSSGKAGIKSTFGNAGDAGDAAAEAAAAEADQQSRYDPQLGLKRLADVYEKSGLMAGVREAGSQFPRFLAQSAPQMAPAIAGGALGARLGTAVAGPLGGLVGTVGGGILGGFLPYKGQAIAEQYRERPGGVLDTTKANVAAVGQAALDEVLPLKLAGARVASKVFGADVARLVQHLGPEAAEEVAKRSLLKTLSRGGIEGIVGEGGTEVAQEVLSRWQAGEPLLNDEALQSYAENFYGGALMGGPLGAAGHAYDRHGARQEVAATEAAAQVKEDAAAAERAGVEQAATAAERQRQMSDPEYISKVEQDYAAYEKTKADMIAQRAAYKAENTDAGRAAYTSAGQEIADFIKSNETLRDEFNAVVRPARAAEKAAADAAAAASAQRYGPAVGTPATVKAPQATMFGQAPGVSDAAKAARVEELQALIAEHEAGMDESAKQARAAVGTRMGSAMTAVADEQAARDKTYQAAKQELQTLLTPEQRKAQVTADAAAAREQALQTFNPVGARKKLAALEAKLAEVEARGDPSELKTAAGWANEIKRVQDLLQEHMKRQAAPAPAEDLFGLGTRLQGEEQAAQRAARTEDVLGRRGARQSDAFGRQLAAEDANLFSDLPQRAGEAADLLTNRLFATRERSGMLDSLAGMEHDNGPDTATLISNRLQDMPDERRAEVARDLQDYGKTVKQRLIAGRDEAHKAGDTAREQSFAEAIRGIAALEEQTKGRAHYEAEFYRLAEPLVPGMTETARRVVGLGPTTSGVQERALMKERAQRLQGVVDPQATAAMQEVADSGETIGEVPQPGRLVPPGTVPRNAPLTDEAGQRMLFQPEAGPEVAPAAALRQRIASVLARPDLTRQAKGTLRQADAALDREHVPQQVLDHVEEMVRNAERGVGGGAAKPVKVTPEGGKRDTTALEGAQVRIRDANAPIPPHRLEGTLRAGPAPKEAAPRAVAGSEAYVPDKTEGTRRPKGFVGPKPETHARHVFPGEAEVRKGTATDHEKVKPQRLEMEQAPTAGRDESQQPDMFDQTYVGRQTPGGFQRALDTGALMPKAPVGKTAAQRIKNLQAEGRVLAWNLKTLKRQFSDALAARGRLAKMAPMLREGEPTKTREFAGLVRKNLLGVTDEALRAQEAANRHTKAAQDARDAAEASGASGEEAEGAAYPHMLKAKQEQMTAGRLFAKVDEFNKALKAIDDRDAAPALEALAEQRQSLRAAVEQAEKQIEQHGKKLLQARKDAGGEAMDARKAKADAIAKSKSGEVGTMGEAKFPTVASARKQATESAKARRMAAREERDALVAKQKQLAVSSPNVQAERITAQSRPAGVTMTVDMKSEGVQDAIKEALHVPSITKGELQAIVERVGTLTKKNAFPSRHGELDTELNEVTAAMRGLKAQSPAGVLPERLQKAYVAATEALAKRQAAISETESAAERAKRIKWMAGTEARIKYLDSKRVPLKTMPEMHALQRRHALATFEAKVLDMQQSIAEAADYQPVGAERKYVAPKREYAQGEVQPQTEIGNIPLSRTQLRADREAKSAFGYKGRGFEPVTAAQERIAAEEEARQSHAQTGESVREIKTSENEGGKTAHKIIRENRPETEPGKEQLRPEPRTPKGVEEAQAAVAKRRVAAAWLTDEEAVARQSEAEHIAQQDRHELLKKAVQAEAVTPTQEEFRAKQQAIANDLNATDDARRDARVLLRALADLQVDPKAEARAALAAQEKGTKQTKEKKAAPPAAAPGTISEDAALVERLRAEYNAAPQGAERKRLFVELSKAMERKVRRERTATDVTREAPIDTMEGEGGRAQMSASTLFDPTTHTPLSDQNMVHIYDGQLDKVLESLAKTGSTPLVRELAAKLQAVVKDTKVMIDTSSNEEHAGEYISRTNTITIHPLALTEETLLHEVGHAATLRMMIAPASSLTREQLNARNGLQSLLTQLQKDPAFSREYGKKNLGELAAEVLSNQNLRDKIDARKPGFIRRFIDAVLQMFGVTRAPRTSKEALAHVERLFQPSRKLTREESLTMRGMLDATAAPSLFRAAPAPTGPRSKIEQFSDKITAPSGPSGFFGRAKALATDTHKGLAFEQAFVDQRAGILKALSKGARDVYDQAQYYLRKSDARMSQVHAVLEHGALQLKKDGQGYHTIEAGGGPSARSVFEAIGKLPGATSEKKFAMAQAYMVAQRAANKGWHKLGWETSAQTRAAGEAMWKELAANPKLKTQLDAVRSVYNEYNKGLINFLAETGSIPKALAKELVKDGDYVPFYRVTGTGPSATGELVLGEGKSIKLGDIRKQPYLQQLKGDAEAKLMPLNDAITRNTMMLTNMGLQNLATKSIAYSLQNMSPKGVNPIHSGHPPAGADVITFRQEPAPGNAKDDGLRWQRITSEGTPFEGIAPEMLVQSLEGSHAVMTGLGRIAAGFSDIVRKGVTRNPAYVIRQLVRDPMAAAFTAGIDRGPVTAMMKAVREFTAQSLGTTATGEALIRKGLLQSGVFTGDAHDLSKLALQLSHGEQGAFAKLTALADRAAMRADAVTRGQVYEDTLKKTGSEMKAELAAMEALNHTKHGSSPSVQHVARMIPFLNSQIQSLNVLAKAMRGNATLEDQMNIRAKFIRSAVSLSIMSMLYSFGMEDDEEYKRASARDRMNNFFVPTPWGTMKIPIPYEPGLLFKALPEAGIRAMGGHFDETDWKALRGALLNTLPGASNAFAVPQALKGVGEVAFNINLGTMAPITPQSQAHLDPSEQYGANTTEFAKIMAAGLRHVPGLGGLNARDVEHLFNAYVGQMPMAAAALANEVLSGKSRPSGDMASLPFVGNLFLRENGTGLVDSAYAKMQAITQATTTYNKMIDSGRVTEAEEYRKGVLDKMADAGAAAAFQAKMKAYHQIEVRVENSKASPEQMRAVLNNIAKAKDAAARELIAQ